MKKLASLLLALTLCLSLAVSATASMHILIVTYPDGEKAQDQSSGDGWTYDYDEGTLTLNGAKDLAIEIGNSPTIVLAPGSKNTLTSLWGGDADYVNDITIKGSGELIIYNPNPNEFRQKFGALGGLVTSLKLQDGLTMTGGPKEGDSGPVEVKAVHTDPNNGFKTYGSVSGGEPALYIRIAPAAGAKPSEAPKPAASGFTDVAASSPYAEAVKWAVEQGITKGTSATAFSPNAVCTEGQIVTFLYRAAGSPKKGSNEWNSVVDWTYDSYIPFQQRDIPCTRINAIYYMWMAQGQPASNASVSFTDVSQHHSAIDAVRWAVEKGITTGTSPTTFSPDATCTRGQIVTFLYRASK